MTMGGLQLPIATYAMLVLFYYNVFKKTSVRGG